ncbi:MAG: retroviral-like aspartic protease family protein [Candidatus Rokubacteria bacterium]|nr:retroviral-like aspartic protease family protein [Candidatus Rokubacteria bacterium]
MAVFEGYRRSVGHFHQDVRLKAKKSRTVRMFVDTGATYSIIPDDVARAIGLVRPERSILMTLADGRRKRFQAGVATFGIEGRRAPGLILVGDVEEPILGVETLEALGLAVDPKRGKLKATRSWTVRV